MLENDSLGTQSSRAGQGTWVERQVRSQPHHCHVSLRAFCSFGWLFLCWVALPVRWVLRVHLVGLLSDPL